MSKAKVAFLCSVTWYRILRHLNRYWRGKKIVYWWGTEEGKRENLKDF